VFTPPTRQTTRQFCRVGRVFTPPTRLDSFVSSAPAVCIGLYRYVFGDACRQSLLFCYLLWFKNPSKPHFNHFLFESICIVISTACKLSPTAISTFEDGLFPPFQTILQQDVQGIFQYLSVSTEQLFTNTKHSNLERPIRHELNSQKFAACHKEILKIAKYS